MTNEMLAQFIQEGGNDELIPILWEKVRKLLYVKADRFYSLYKSACDGSGVDVWDIRQASYSAFLDAVKAYKAGGKIKFTSYLNYPFKNAVQKLLGIRGSRREPLNNCTSLDKPIEQSNGETCSMLDLVADDTSLDFVEEAERNSEAETVRKFVDELSEPYRSVIKAKYFDGLTLGEIGEKFSVSRERIRQQQAHGLRILRRNPQLRKLYTEQECHYDWLALARFKYSPEYYEIVRRAEERQLSYGQRQADLRTAFSEWYASCEDV